MDRVRRLARSAQNDGPGAAAPTGRMDDAIALHERNLADRTRILGPDHPDTLTSRNNLATAYQLMRER